MTDKRIALITGANKGIGYHIAAGLGSLGWSLGIGARDPERREDAVARLRATGIDAFGVPLDVTSDASVADAAALLNDHGGRLDALVNNAGIPGSLPQTPSSIDLKVMHAVIDTNVYGVIRVTNAVLPLLRRSTAPRIVNVSSSVGSLTRQSASNDPTVVGPNALAYAPSKTFLNAVTLQYARELADTNILINLTCPGFVDTDFNNHRGTRTPQQGAATAIRLATLPDDGPTGGFFEDAGIVPW